MDIKDDHELDVARSALRAFGINASSVAHGGDGEPDCIYTHSSEHIGIEVTTAYYTKESAESAWRAARDHRQGITGRFYFTGIMTNADDSLIASCIRQVQKKSSKKYSGVGRVVLLLHIDAPLSEDEILVQASTAIEQNLPDHSFHEIWIGRYRPSGDYQAIRVQKSSKT
jgi:hypothetical protein